MSNVRDFKSLHGCGCDNSGLMVERRSLDGFFLTRHYEVDVQHESGVVHTTEYEITTDGVVSVYKGSKA